jgi:hypothetical protein
MGSAWGALSQLCLIDRFRGPRGFRIPICYIKEDLWSGFLIHCGGRS